MNQNNLQALIENAIEDGINLKRLYLASGLCQDDFELHYRDQLFSYDEIDALEVEIKQWMKGV